MRHRGKEKIAEKRDTDSESESETTSAGEEVEGWWKAGKKGKKSKKVRYVCRGGDDRCDKTITSKEAAIECEACREWYHPNCQGLCKGAFEAVSEYQLLWICMICRERLAESLDLGRRVEMRVAEAEKRVIRRLLELRFRLQQILMAN